MPGLGGRGVVGREPEALLEGFHRVRNPALALQEQAKLARSKEGLTPFYGTWDVFARAELHKAYLGQESAMEALNNMAAKWNELKEQ